MTDTKRRFEGKLLKKIILLETLLLKIRWLHPYSTGSLCKSGLSAQLCYPEAEGSGRVQGYREAHQSSD